MTEIIKTTLYGPCEGLSVDSSHKGLVMRKAKRYLSHNVTMKHDIYLSMVLHILQTLDMSRLYMKR